MKLEMVTAMVTGGASGLGRATAERLIAAGAKVALLDRRGSSGEQVARELGSSALFLPADITSGSDVSAALQTVREQLGNVSVLVNCAGMGSSATVLGPRGPAKLEDFTRVIEVNLIGTFNCIRLAAAQMAKNEPSPDGERGVIINTSSIAAFEGQIGQAAYTAAKAGIVGMTLPIARELGELGIRVMTIAPGLFDTPMMVGVPEQIRASLLNQIPFPRRLGRTEEFSGLVLHIIENAMLNGETIRLDGAVRYSPR
jgi:3-hydroxyacyl-CoA dehydrogenase / 3-hydroxy-2-methylbutyryl-CoA dehydrogenase